MKPLVSIIVPIYNVENYLERCIDSIVNQTYSNIEIILVNDGSPDKSPLIADRYARLDSRIHVIHKNNGGLSDARNAGLSFSSGEHICFVDSDDYIDPSMVEDAVIISEKMNADVVIWGFYTDFVDENEKLISSKTNQFITETFSKYDISNMPITIETIGMLGYAWNKMYRKDLLLTNNLKFTKGISLVEDIVFNGPVLAKAKRITFIERPYVHYVQRPRETLGAKFYENYYDLKEMAMNAVESMLNDWGKTDQEISLIRSQMGFNALKSASKLLSKAENYKRVEKKAYLHSLVSKSDVQDNIKTYRPQNYKDMIIKFLMLKRKTNLLLIVYSGKKNLGGHYDK